MSIQDEFPLVTLHNAIVAAQASMRHPRMDKGAQTFEALRMILDAATKDAMQELRDLRARAVEMERSEPARKIREYRERCVATYGKSPTDYESGVVQGIDCALSFLPPAP